MLTNVNRQNVVAGLLVAAVVLVIGFGSGIGSVLTRHNATGSTSTTQQAIGAPTTPGAGGSGSSPLLGGVHGFAGTGSSGRVGGAVMSASTAPTSASSPGTTVAPSGKSPTSPAAKATTAPSTSTASCANTMLVNAFLDPFVVHLDKAHLEESPGQQVSQALNVDNYVLLHTVMVEDMVMPLVAAVQNSLNGVDPFIVHLDKAHLEESPGQQVSQLLNVDDYVLLHTVLVEDMLAPAEQSVTGSC